MIYSCFDKKVSATCANEIAGGAVKSEIMLKQEQEIAKNLHKLINKMFENKNYFNLLKKLFGVFNLAICS